MTLFLIALKVLVLMSVMAFSEASESRSDILNTNIHVFDGVNEQRLMDASVRIERNIISEIAQGKIDASGLTPPISASIMARCGWRTVSAASNVA
ncbi:MAG: hypothetical protein V7708_09775 [Oceanicoccus sp.]